MMSADGARRRDTIDPRWLALCAVVVAAVFLLLPPIPQDENYHVFADGRELAGIANFWNVVSNLPFLLVGIAGLRKSRSLCDRALFTGVLLTGFGSAWYHLAPNDATLVWDRIPMTLIFMSFVSCAFENERILFPLLTFGGAAVMWWRVTNDLRPYGIAKLGPILLMLPAMFSDSIWPPEKRRYVMAIVGVFGRAQFFELQDRTVYSMFPISGHTVKHLVAGLATYFLLRWRGPAA
jgi:hypothetical protein